MRERTTAQLAHLPGVLEAGRVHESAQRKLADALRLQQAIAAARAEGRTEDLRKLKQLAAEIEPALMALDREIRSTHHRMRREVFDFTIAAVADEVRRLEDRKARRMKRSWRR